MPHCTHCSRPLSSVKYTIEEETPAYFKKYYFDTKACMVTWVRETYGTENN